MLNWNDIDTVLLDMDGTLLPQRTLFIDDSLPVLRAARQFGIAHLLAVAKPDSQQPTQETQQFTALHQFCDIMPGAD